MGPTIWWDEENTGGNWPIGDDGNGVQTELLITPTPEPSSLLLLGTGLLALASLVFWRAKAAKLQEAHAPVA